MKIEITPNMIQWLANGSRGISSETMFQTITGIPCLDDKWGRSHPRDPADLCRCMNLLEQCPELVPHISKMKRVSKAWRALIENWGELTTMLRDECPDWFGGRARSKAIKTWDRMREVIDGAGK